MKIPAFIFCLTFSLALCANEAQKMIDTAHCMECHNTSDFNNPDSKVKNHNDLYNVIDSCQRNNDVMWFEDETLFVADYLNKHYYKFKKK